MADDDDVSTLAVLGVEEEEKGDGEHGGQDGDYDRYARPKRRETCWFGWRRRWRWRWGGRWVSCPINDVVCSNTRRANEERESDEEEEEEEEGDKVEGVPVEEDAHF